MPDGKTHLAINTVGALIVFCVSYLFVGVSHAGLIAGAYLVGELLLSPDLDHPVGSDAYRRWFLLRWIWIPYQKLLPHRSPLSHWPVFGTAGRILWLCLVSLAVLVVIELMGTRVEIPVPAWPETAYALLGVELAAITHWVADRAG